MQASDSASHTFWLTITVGSGFFLFASLWTLDETLTQKKITKPNH